MSREISTCQNVEIDGEKIPCDFTVEYEMKDSGKRALFPTGAQRDTSTNKPRPDLISPYVMKELFTLHADGWRYDKAECIRGLVNNLTIFRDDPQHQGALVLLSLQRVINIMYLEIANSDTELYNSNRVLATGLLRIGEWLRLGAIKYNEWNWAKGIPVSRCYESAIRHLMQYLSGATDEDHLAALGCNLMFIYHYYYVIEMGYMEAEIKDLKSIKEITCHDEQ